MLTIITIAAVVATAIATMDWLSRVGISSVVIGFEDETGFNYGSGHGHRS
jgi:hypothetical protein